MGRALTTAVSLCLLLLPAPVRPQEPQDELPRFVQAFGREGSGLGFLRLPGGMAVDDAGNTYVAEIIGDRVQKFGPDGKGLMYWEGSPETGPLNEPSDVVVDHQGRIWVADRGNNRILCFTQQGDYIWGLGEKDGDEFSAPNGLGLHPTMDLLYVADTYHSRVRVLDLSGATPVMKASYGDPGPQAGAMSAPTDVAISSTGEIHIVEPAMNRVQIFSPTGKFRLAMGRWGTLPGMFNNPIGIAVDSNDDIYVVDTFNGRIQKFHRDGVFVYEWGITQIKIELLNHPLRAHITQDGLIYIADTPGNVIDAHRIVVFDLQIVEVTRKSWSDVRKLYR